MSYIPLNVYSAYSFRRSGLAVSAIVALAKKEGLSYCALADRDYLTGAPELYKYCKKEGIAPIFGINLVLPQGSISLYVSNEKGYSNLCQCILASSKGEFDTAFLANHGKGLIGVLDCADSFIAKSFLDDAASIPTTLSEIDKGLDALYLGLPRLASNEALREFLRVFVSSYPYPLVAFPRLAYAKKEGAVSVAILEALENGVELTQKTAEGPYYWLSEEEIQAEFTESEIEATEIIAKQASNFEFGVVRGSLPHFPCPSGLSSEEYLRILCDEGLKKKIANPSQVYLDRLEMELNVILSMGYADYFLLVGDLVAFAKNQGILIGPGRGSAVGSLVSFALDITRPDPIEFGLLFERFLNPERATMPDIDLDIPSSERDIAVNYLTKKYGHEYVSAIMTVTKVGAKQSIIDIAKTFAYEERDQKYLSSTINSELSLRQNYRHTKDFKDLVDSDPFYLEYVSLASKIEGLPRQPGRHPAGVVINDKPLKEVIPLVEDPASGYIEQFEKDHLQNQGFLKMDILSLINLETISVCLRSIEEQCGVKIHYEDIPWDDAEAMKLVAEGKTVGLFQLEGASMTKTMRLIAPRNMLELAAGIALHRPGPFAYILTYANRKAGREPVRYPSKQLEPLLKPILGPTFGVLVFQEQVMQIAQAVAGFSYGQADILRAAISHKKLSELVTMKDAFFKGALAKGIPQEQVEALFKDIEAFASYGFNKSHAIGYAVIALQEAYLKAHYPLQFYSAFLPASRDPAKVMQEIKRRGIHFHVPDINASGIRFLPYQGELLFPLSSIKGLSAELYNGIIDERNAKGPFVDLFDVSLRLKKYRLDVQALVRLIDAGALDCICSNRASLRLNAPSAISYADMICGQDGETLLDFDLPKPALRQIEPSKEEDIAAERAALGMSISCSPLDSLKEAIAKANANSLADLETARYSTLVAGVIGSIRVRNTKTGKKMAHVTVYDDSSEIEFTVFEDAYNKSFAYLKPETPVLVSARPDRQFNGKFIADSFSPLKGDKHEQ